ncbi:helix-turn-helix domain-containing protein [Roseiconus lacunae]|uniref:helix-turn-helix domain-containing protein n=1 Tax=Roseiconus lacunae TaxID=2605694 RepID=UPI003F534C56
MTKGKPSDKPTLLTADEVASELRLTGHCVRKLAAKGQIPSVRIGGSLRFHRLVVEDIIAASRGADEVAPSESRD